MFDLNENANSQETSNSKQKSFNLDDYLTDDSQFLIIAGPCALESYEQVEEVLKSTDELNVLRSGIYKMRTNPNTFQGLGLDGVDIIAKIKKQRPFDFITEVTDPRQIADLVDVVDIFQVGSRNMYNYDLLRELNAAKKPVLFKRAFSATVKEWLNACDYMPDLGEEKILLCERGIRTFETSTRNTLDINTVVYLKQNTNFKVIVDPSHASGIASMVRKLSHVGMAAGADGLLIECHPNPSVALSDKDQQITPAELNQIRRELAEMGQFFGKKVL